MEEVSLEVETVTPLFIAGGNREDIVSEGLRAPTLKGLMRWWFRALAGNYLGNNISLLKKVESEIFGSTDMKSNVVLRSLCTNRPHITKTKSWSKYVDYLFFSCRIRGPLPYYKEKSTFKITITGCEKELKVALACMWAIIYLGAVGFRARRGAGCLKVTNVIGNTYGLNFRCNVSNNLADFLKDNIPKAIQIIRERLNMEQSVIQSVPEYPILSPAYSALFIRTGPFKSWINALDEVGRWYIGSQSNRKFVGGFRMDQDHIDYRLSHQIRNASSSMSISSEKERRPYLGLPVPYANYRATLVGKDYNRRASPLLFGVYNINDSYFPRILILLSQFLPDFNGEFRIEKKVNKDVTINIDGKLANVSFEQIMKEAAESLSTSGWTRVWGEL